MRAHRRLGAIAALGLAAVLGLTGCLPGACTTVGYLDSLTVNVVGDTGAVAAIEVCGAERCDRAAAGSAQQTGAASWRFEGLSPAKTVTVRALSADGSELGAAEATPTWRRVGGTEQCGGPHEAEVELSL